MKARCTWETIKTKEVSDKSKAQTRHMYGLITQQFKQEMRDQQNALQLGILASHRHHKNNALFISNTGGEESLVVENHDSEQLNFKHAYVLDLIASLALMTKLFSNT
ncbi:unnamed protein product [Sphenostylis stenocarpa]|uniref:Uncharacterized protein n=1 Tax=Sphenostylis stenocarpa TaxID=92480 RepID=A0AA86VJ84_9FABA|nr:unnamed protein product [Sphenostylis stenocarpa]